MKLRFMRIGLNIEAVTDSHIMKVNSVILDESCLVIGISVSGQTADIISSLKAAHQRGAYTLLMTARQDKSYQEFCDETLIFASMEHPEYGNIISPQFPILLVLDVLYDTDASAFSDQIDYQADIPLKIPFKQILVIYQVHLKGIL